jgi:hypothetical protein
LKLTAQGTPTTQDLGGIFQILDGKDTAQFLGSTAVSISVWLKASSGITSARVRILAWIGTEDAPSPSDPISDWGSAGSDPVLETNWNEIIDSGQITVTTGWVEYKTENEDISAATTMKNLAILITVDDDTYIGGDTLEITGVQIENGSTSSGFGHRDYGQELTRCQRYYTNSFDDGVDPRDGVGETGAVLMTSINRTNAGDMNVGFGYEFPIQMRAAPTIKVYNPVNQTVDSFYEQRTPADVLQSLFVTTSTERRANFTLINAQGGRIISGHIQAEAEF